MRITIHPRLGGRRVLTAFGAIVSWAGLLLKLAVGAIGDVQAISAADGTFALLVSMMLEVPIWAYALAAIVTTFGLAWSLILETIAVAKQVDELKETSQKAWAFSAEINGFRDQITSFRADLSRMQESVSSLHIVARENSDFGYLFRKEIRDSISEALNPKIHSTVEKFVARKHVEVLKEIERGNRLQWRLLDDKFNEKLSSVSSNLRQRLTDLETLFQLLPNIEA